MSRKFIRHASHRKKRLSPSYRRPKGLHNKMRLQKKGHRGPLKEGYKQPNAEQHRKNGLLIATVYAVKDLDSLDKKEYGILIGKTGTKNKLAILKAVEQQGFTLLRGDAKTTHTNIQQRYDERKQETEEKRKERDAKQKELEKLAQEKEKSEESEKTEKDDQAQTDGKKKNSDDKKGSDGAQKQDASAKETKKSTKKTAKQTSSKSSEEKSEEDKEKDKVLTKAR